MFLEGRIEDRVFIRRVVEPTGADCETEEVVKEAVVNNRLPSLHARHMFVISRSNNGKNTLDIRFDVRDLKFGVQTWKIEAVEPKA